MINEYDPRKDPFASEYEKKMYDFFISCMATGRYNDGLVIIKTSDIPQYMKDKFKSEFENKLEQGRKARESRLKRKII
jgi:hypothetical protein